MVLAAPNQGEVELVANLLRESELPYRLGTGTTCGQREHLRRVERPGGKFADADSGAQHAAHWGEPAGGESCCLWLE